MLIEEFDNIILKKPLYNNLTKAVIPLLTALVIIGSVYFLIIEAEAATQALIRDIIIRICISVLIFIISIIPFFKKNYYIITSYKIVQYNKWELLYKDIKAIDMHKNFLKRWIEITPKKNPEIKFIINQWEINRDIKFVTDELIKRIKHSSSKL
jgi:hypothetical protein